MIRVKMRFAQGGKFNALIAWSSPKNRRLEKRLLRAAADELGLLQPGR